MSQETALRLLEYAAVARVLVPDARRLVRCALTAGVRIGITGLISSGQRPEPPPASAELLKEAQ
ncbi:hypothetical protein [Streptomyces sp. NPDC001380]|uniref:hypothetical protein n=1 Tax=Streptomyces sp. NPDC001380 TaxID=3364566 RepID=UPI0036A8DC0A